MTIQFDVRPFHVEIVLEKMSLLDMTVSPPISVETREPTDGERAEFGYAAMEWFRSMGHECNASCSPPLRHTSQSAHDEIEVFLTKQRRTNCTSDDPQDHCLDGPAIEPRVK